MEGHRTLLRSLLVAVSLATVGCFGSGDIGPATPGPTSNPVTTEVPSTDTTNNPGEIVGTATTPAAIAITAAQGGVDATPVSDPPPSPHNMNMTPARPPRLTADHRAAFPTDAE